jgi:EAL domain-containing protein (putative c-di-GMP-specific phosphodiesterase class I)
VSVENSAIWAFGERPRVLVVDDERSLLKATGRLLRGWGFESEECESGAEALEALRRGRFHTVLTDVAMPGVGGIALLRAIRQFDTDLPVIMVTGGPTLETAIEALDHGAFRYLVKPVDFDDLRRVTQQAVQLNLLARAKQEALRELGEGAMGFSGGELQSAFSSALDSLWPAFQPIVKAKDGAVFAYEALVRSKEPRLPEPSALLDAAERLGQLDLLSHAMRQRTTREYLQVRPKAQLFLNLHPLELHDPELLDQRSSTFACRSRLVLEVTERATLERAGDVRGRVKELREAGYRIAIDDLGAGYAGLNSFATLEPEFVKLDMALVRDVHQTPVKQRLIRVMTSLCHDLNMQVIAEGIEAPEERDTCIDLGCDFLQGFLHGRPQAGFRGVHELERQTA